MLTFKEIHEATGLTLRQIALHANIKYYRINNARKKPIPGKVYDPDAINWFAIDAILTKADKKNLNSVEWDKIEGSKSVKVEYDYDAFIVGSRWHLRRFGWVTIVYHTATHVVLLEDGSETPRAWKMETFIMNSPSETER